MKKKNKNNIGFLKVRGYKHLTDKVRTKGNESFEEMSKRITFQLSNSDYISKYNFFPLLKYVKIERKYKKATDKIAEDKGKTVFLHQAEGKPIRKNEPKERPIEYPTHRDAMIYAFYAQKLLAPAYEHLLSLNPALDESVIGYRKISVEKNSSREENKSTIHFAKEVFEGIQSLGECHVLTFDIKKFFPSLDHEYLRNALIKLIADYSSNPVDTTTVLKDKAEKYNLINKKLKEWNGLIVNKKLPPDLYKVFMAVTRYAYIMLPDLMRKDGKKGFDESRLANIRSQGVEAFFENPAEMRKYLFDNKVVIHKNAKKGIPHGLPISAYLANIYMREFDAIIIEKLKEIDCRCFYRRYSDDMIVVFPKGEDSKKGIKELFEGKEGEKREKSEVEKIKLKLSRHKTEFFNVRYENDLLVSERNLVFQIGDELCNSEEQIQRYPITYLGLEFHGEIDNGEKRLDVRLKNSSIVKFYRRMDMAVRRQVRRAFERQEKTLQAKPLVFRRKLYRLFSLRGANRKYKDKKEEMQIKEIPKKIKYLVFDPTLKLFKYKHKVPKEPFEHMGNAITFAKRCDYIFFGTKKQVNKVTGEEKELPVRVMYRQYRKANLLLEKRIAYWVEKYGKL